MTSTPDGYPTFTPGGPMGTPGPGPSGAPGYYQAQPGGYEAQPGSYETPGGGYGAAAGGYQGPPPGGYQAPLPGGYQAPAGAYQGPAGAYQAPPPSGYQGQVLVTVGDIACTQTEVVTPTSRAPLRGTTWMVANQTTVTERIPTYAIVLAIIFALACLLGLLFLLVKEKAVQGFVQVSVQGPGLYYATQVPVGSDAQVRDVEARVNYIRSLVSALG